MIDLIREDFKRKFPAGAEVLKEGGVHFRVWAPGKKRVEIIFEDNLNGSILPPSNLLSEDNGYFSAVIPEAEEGMMYRYRLDDNNNLYPDPASRFQPQGPHGSSQIINPDNFKWKDKNWTGVNLKGQIIYELHIGTFTKEGLWKSAINELKELADLGITLIEIMPVADFTGKYGWGYDGVNLFAPTRLYGHPDDLREFVNEAHQLGIGLILDVVYNHLGPDGNYLREFSPYYFNKDHITDWGEAINFDGENSLEVRKYIISNAVYWIKEFHFDGLRLDATQSISDKSPKHILAEITENIKKEAGSKSIITIAENEPQDVKLLKDYDKGGYEIDAMWNDDFHHSAMVALTGRKEAYYTDYLGNPQEFISAIKYGFIYQGQLYKWQKKRRGTSARGIPHERFVHFIQNHDQVANSGRGYYCHKLTSPGRFKAMSALLIFGPQTPMIFQGQEFAASNSFFYFADHKEELAKIVNKGRAEFLSQFRSLALPETQAIIPDPSGMETFYNSKLDFSERKQNAEIYSMYKDLILLRKKDEVISLQGKSGIDGAVLSSNAFVLRFFSENENKDRLLVINFGIDLDLNPAPEPLLAPPADHGWEIIFSTEDFKYGGIGTAPLETDENWKIPGHAGVVLAPVKRKENPFD